MEKEQEQEIQTLKRLLHARNYMLRNLVKDIRDDFARGGIPRSWLDITDCICDLVADEKGEFLPTTHYVVVSTNDDIEFSTPISIWGSQAAAWDFCNQHINDCMQSGIAGAGKWVIRGALVDSANFRVV